MMSVGISLPFGTPIPQNYGDLIAAQPWRFTPDLTRSHGAMRL
jgi:hypothetical protein